jgi:serine phosphatase RsbU (regulator of sigma subunit)
VVREGCFLFLFCWVFATGLFPQAEYSDSAFQFDLLTADDLLFKTDSSRLILNNSHLSMKEQEQSLENTIEKWMGNIIQVDDICIIGLSFKV